MANQQKDWTKCFILQPESAPTPARSRWSRGFDATDCQKEKQVYGAVKLDNKRYTENAIYFDRDGKRIPFPA